MKQPKFKIINKKITLWFSLSASFILAVFFTCLLLTVISSIYMSNFILESSRARIHDIVGLAVLKIDADQHSKITKEEHKDLIEFSNGIKVLNSIKDTSEDIKYVYTLRENENKEIVFVIDSDPVLDSRASINTKVENPAEGLIKCFKEKKSVIVNEDYYTDKWGTWMSGFAPFYNNKGEFEGVLAIDISVNTIKSKQFNSIILICIISLCVVLLSGVISIVLSNRISRPVLEVTKEMSEIQKFNIDNKLNTKSSIIEIKEMILALENMKKSLRSFKKYVPSEIVVDLITMNKEAVLEVEKKEITIFFSDIADFTSISEKVKPEILSKMLGIYLGLITKTILSEKGTVDKYIGDAVMAIWGAPHDLENHPLHSCVAALKCQNILTRLNRRFEKINLPALNSRIGLNTGEAIVGNMGYSQRLSYTAIGDNVNLASRLEAINKVYHSKIIISHSTYLAVKDFVEAKFLDVVAVKGKTNGIRIYELISLKEKTEIHIQKFIEEYNSAMELYIHRQWDSALDKFTQLRNQSFKDYSISMMIDRCILYKKNPPPLSWDGVIHLKEK